jgi:hypothetical protein
MNFLFAHHSNSIGMMMLSTSNTSYILMRPIMKFTITTVLLCSLAMSSVALAKNDKEKPLPPGLQKKVAEGQPLPPGWQKKIAVGNVLDASVYAHAKVVLRDNGIETLSIEGKIIRVLKNTLEVVEIISDL